ncbi:MAG: RpiB/LacA/LacB family sugar-phosphate isomerase [SAR202 cluster bacterium]|nr:RpiB/LacA/LacB family sugar-phosphate isomerase [SAR202 cluster bacterium]
MKICFSSDHNGLELKNRLVEYFSNSKYEIIDLGPKKFDPNDDYPDSAILVAQGISLNDFDKGIIICGSGVGASIAANKVPGVRAAICHDSYSASQGVEHDDMNVLCLGSKIVDFNQSVELVEKFLSAKFSKEHRFHRRLKKVLKIENDLNNYFNE